MAPILDLLFVLTEQAIFDIPIASIPATAYPDILVSAQSLSCFLPTKALGGSLLPVMSHKV
jgi:hypothetical protein